MSKTRKTIGMAAGCAAVLLSASPAAAAPPYQRFALSDADDNRLTSREYDRCMDESGGVTINMRDCASAEGDRLDARLNTAYRVAMARLANQPARNKLRDLERRWLATRWRECHRETDSETGTIGLIMLDSCELSEMKRRVAWLERQAR